MESGGVEGGWSGASSVADRHRVWRGRGVGGGGEARDGEGAQCTGQSSQADGDAGCSCDARHAMVSSCVKLPRPVATDAPPCENLYSCRTRMLIVRWRDSQEQRWSRELPARQVVRLRRAWIMELVCMAAERGERVWRPHGRSSDWRGAGHNKRKMHKIEECLGRFVYEGWRDRAGAFVVPDVWIFRSVRWGMSNEISCCAGVSGVS